MLTDLLKAIVPLVHPLGFVWLLLGLWLIWKFLRKDRRGLFVPTVAWLIYTVMTCTPTASLLMANLENTVPHQKVAELPVVDAIVCLGGIAEPSTKEVTGFHLRSAADRLSTALVLFREKKAPTLVVGGGKFEVGEKKEVFSEADHLVEGAGKMGVNTEGIVSLGLCANTRDEAEKVAKLMQERGWERIILVTSAAHMPRSKAVFEKQGIDLVAAPCNYISLMNRIGDWEWIGLPSSDELGVFGAWLHEMIGMQMYRLRGWVD